MLELAVGGKRLRFHLSKAVEVQLSHEGRPVVVLVDSWDDCLGELVNVVNHEGAAVRGPAPDLRGAGADQSMGLGIGD